MTTVVSTMGKTGVTGAEVTSNDRLEQTWATPTGIMRFLTAVNHRVVGARYLVTGLTFFVLAGVAALLMRIQLAVPENTFLNPALYNQLFTTHGTTVMFLFAVPIMEGIGIYLIPLMIGARDMAFPKLNAFGYFVYLVAGVTIRGSLFFGVAPDGGLCLCRRQHRGGRPGRCRRHSALGGTTSFCAARCGISDPATDGRNDA
ncbi:MAG: cbb3-type cytochrome c oxidase subunit I [Caldilineaceae bacterium]